MKRSHIATLGILMLTSTLFLAIHLVEAQTISTINPGFLPDYFCQETFGRHASFSIVNSTGFSGIYYLYYDHTLVYDYILTPGQTATVTYEEHNGLPTYLEGEFQFFHDDQQGSHPRTDVYLSMVNATADSAYSMVTITADQDAAQGTYWLIFPPGVCTGGSVILLTIGDSPSIVPQTGSLDAHVENHGTDDVVVVNSSPYILANLTFFDPAGRKDQAYNAMVDPDGTSARWFTPTRNGTYTAVITSAVGNVTLPFNVSEVHEKPRTTPHLPQYPTIGNREIETALKLYSSSATPRNQNYLWFRFFDENTNTTIQHITFFLTATKGNQTVFRELLHTHTGVLTLNITSTNDTTWQVYGDHEPILNGWVPHESNEPLAVSGPLFNDPNATYHLNIQLFTIDYDNNLFDITDNPNNLLTFNFYLDAKDKNQVITSSNLPLANRGGILVTNNSPIGYLKIRQVVYIQTPVANFSPRLQNFTYITEEFDKKGFVNSIQKFDGNIDSMANATLSNVWYPTEADNYTVDSFVWDKFTSNPVPIANSLKTTVEVR